MDVVEFLQKKQNFFLDCVRSREEALNAGDLEKVAKINDAQAQHTCDTLQGMRVYLSELKELSEKEPWNKDYKKGIEVLETYASLVEKEYQEIERGQRSGEYLTNLPDLSHLLE